MEEQLQNISPKEGGFGGESKSNFYMIPAAIIIAGAMIGASVIYSNATLRKGGSAPTGAEANMAGAAAAENLIDGDDPVLGNQDAPVTVVEFADFQCPFCGRFSADAFPQIKEKYISTGKVKFVYRDYPLPFHPIAQPAAEAGACANEQGKFWEYHDYIFAHQADLSVPNLKAWAQGVELDAARFNNCFDSHKYSAEVKKDTADGQKAGVSGTPSTFINGRLVVGAVPFEQFQSVIEEELKKVK